MRLLNTDDLMFRDFLGEHTEPYAILSHCWSCTPGQDEPTYQQVIANTVDHDSCGWKKVEKCCAIARERGLQWAWIDTVCIDKTSSAELSEAINSMYAWYQGSVECYVLLDDIDGSPSLQARTAARQQFEQTFQRSRWFTRGWTLQELLAPSSVLFYDKDGYLVGSRIELAPMIARATGIHENYITKKHSIVHASVAQRFSWASQRKTTRPEDLSYSLLGIFQVNMPLLYGEGKKAFLRLQLAIIEVSDDDSIFAWGIPPASEWSTSTSSLKIQEPMNMLASSPSDFSGSHDVIWNAPMHGFASASKPLPRPMPKCIEYRQRVPIIATLNVMLFNKKGPKYGVYHSLRLMALVCQITEYDSHHRIEIGLHFEVKNGYFYRVAFRAHGMTSRRRTIISMLDLFGFKKTMRLATLPLKEDQRYRENDTLQERRHSQNPRTQIRPLILRWLPSLILLVVANLIFRLSFISDAVVIYMFICLRDLDPLFFYIILPASLASMAV